MDLQHLTITSSQCSLISSQPLCHQHTDPNFTLLPKQLAWACPWLRHSQGFLNRTLLHHRTLQLTCRVQLILLPVICMSMLPKTKCQTKWLQWHIFHPVHLDNLLVVLGQGCHPLPHNKSVVFKCHPSLECHSIRGVYHKDSNKDNISNNNCNNKFSINSHQGSKLP